MRSVFTVIVGLALMAGQGCGPASNDNTATAETGTSAQVSPEMAKINEQVSKIINDATSQFASLDYEFNEDLLKILDTLSAYFESKPEARASLKLDRYLPSIDQADESAHFAESIKRWETKSGKNMRAEVNRLKAILAKRDVQEKQSLVNFNKEFSSTFDDFVKIEVDELRERRNRLIHEKARPLLESLRAKDAAAATKIETTLNSPPYNLPTR